MPENARVLAECGGTAAAFEFDWGKGSAVVLASPFGVVSDRAVSGKIKYDYDVPLPNPYPLLLSAEKIYRNELEKTVLFDVGEGLGSIVCRKGEKSKPKWREFEKRRSLFCSTEKIVSR